MMTADELIAGRANLDLMKERIHEIVEFLLRLIAEETTRGAYDLKFQSRAYRWHLVREGNSSVPYVHCLFGDRYIFSTLKGWTKEPAMSEIGLLYDSLEALISGAIENFPSVAEKLLPIAIAAQRKL